ncbi:MAG: beta-galactosidase trimerization domain-containing protein, partial [Planctomycetales bacterium]|nr:beta-galactosidase trimerization domain-containing protein [Planctomycetales bacterium]
MATLLCVGGLFPDATVAQRASPAMPWFQRAIVGMEVGPTGAQFGYSSPTDERYCSKWNGAEIVRKCVEANAEYLVLWLRDGDFAYYNSKILPKAPGLGNRDPLREAQHEAAKHDLPIISYCVVQQGGIYLQGNPQWKMRDAEGNEIGRFCFNSGYLAAIKQLVAEQLAYGIDGFHIDMLDQGFGEPYGCWCDACRELFRKAYGHPMPSGVTWDKTWDEMLEFRYASSERFEKELTTYIRSLNSRATVDFNYHGNPPFSWEVGQRPVQHAVVGDGGGQVGGVWGFSPLTVGLNAEFYPAATPGVPYQVAMQRGVRGYHDQTTRPLADLRWELLTLLAHGAFVTMIDKTAFDGALDSVAYERIGDAFADARALRKHFGDLPVQDVGVWYSARSRDWIGREQSGLWNLSFLGAHKALAYEHIPWGVVLDENVDLPTLEKFPVIWLPNVGIVSEEHVALLTQYVDRGGALVVTGQTGCYDRYGKLQERSSLESLIGARLVRPLATLDNWVRFEAPWETARPEWPLLTYGP